MSGARGEGVCEPVSVIVLAGGRAASLDACLLGLSEQVAAPEMVITVVDSAPSDGSAAFALAHPAVQWVTLTSEPGTRALWQRGSASIQTPYAAILSAAHRPDRMWLATGLAQLHRGADVVVRQPCSTWAEGTSSLFLKRHVPTRIPFYDLADADDELIPDFVYRCRAAGYRVVLASDIDDGLLSACASAEVWPRDGVDPIARPFPASVPPKPHRPSIAAVFEGGLISVILCTSGKRPDQLQRCIKSLSGLDDPNFEIVVVENTPSKSLALDELEGTVATHVHEPRQGLDRARNAGVRMSSGELLAFIDDDCEADAGWLTALRRTFADPTVAFATGRVRPAELDRRSQQWFEVRFSFDRGPFRQRFTRFDGGGWSPLATGALGTGANMAFRRSVLEHTGAFDVALDMGTLLGGGGDLDMFARALSVGEVCEYTPDAVVFHHHRDDLTKLRWQTWGYGLCQGAMCVKYSFDRGAGRLRALRRYLRLLRDHQHRLAAVRRGKDRYPTDLALLELVGIAVGPLVYLASLVQQGGTSVR